MRYGKERKQATRQRIIETAGRRFKADGIDGSGIAALMADAGLTNGAFYAHFDSKDDLVATAVADQLREQCEGLSAAAPGRAGVEQILREYLSVQHRDSPEHGCPSAALQPEFVREVGGWIYAGKLHYQETVVDGLENTLDAFLALMRGENLGKMVVRL